MSNFKPHPIGRFPHWADAESATEKEYASEDESDALGDVRKFFGDVWNGAGTFMRVIGVFKDSDAESTTETEAVGHHGGPHSAGGAPIRYTEVPGESWRVKDPSEVPSNSGDQSPEAIYARSQSLPNAAKPQAFYAPGAGGEAKSDLTPEANALGDSGAESEVAGFGEGGSNSPNFDPVEPGFGQTGESILKESGMDGLRESGMDGLRELDPQTAAADSLTGEAEESTGNFTSTVRRIFSQSDSLTGDGLAKADTDSSGWFQMHHDDGIQDGYLDVDADASGFDSFLLQNGSDLIAPIAEPFADAAAITDLVTGKSSPMEAVADPLVAAGPLDAVKVDEPRNNDF